MEEEHTQQQLQARRDVLQDADQRQRNAFHTVGEADQRHCGDCAAEDQQQVVAPAPAMEERAAVAILGPDREGQRRQEQVHAFHAQAGHRVD